MESNRHAWRKFKSRLIATLCVTAAVVAVMPLALVFIHLVQEGFSAVNWAFFTQMPKPVGEPGGGMANAIFGTLVLIGIAAAFAVPVGVVCGIHLAEYPGRRFTSIVRFAADVLNGVPSIVV